MDECGIQKDLQPRLGRAVRGQRVISFQAGRRYKRLNIIAGLYKEKVIAPYYYDWSTNSEWFEIWLEWHLCPLLKPGSVLVLDNARFHRQSEVERIAKFFRLQVLWLPPYSPDKNKIEKVWANLKNFIRRQGRKFKSLQQSIDSYFKT